MHGLCLRLCKHHNAQKVFESPDLNLIVVLPLTVLFLLLNDLRMR